MPHKVKGISVRFDRTRKVWRIWFHIGNERWTESFQDKLTADQAAVEYGKRHLRGEDIRPERLRTPESAPGAPKAGTVRHEGITWLTEGQTARRGATNHAYATHLKLHIFPALGDLRVSDKELTLPVCIKFARALVGKVSEETGRPLTHATRRAICATLSSFCGWARHRFPETFPFNPADDLRGYIIDADEPDPEIVVWTHTEADRLVQAAAEHYPHWRVMLEVAIKTGLRIGELHELRWSKDFQIPHHISVQRQFLRTPRRTYGRDDRGRLVSTINTTAPRVVSTKGKERRLVPLRPDVERLLDEHRAAQRKWAFKRSVPIPDLTFVGVQGGRGALVHFEQRVLPMLCRLAKVPVTTHLHTTRHTFATVLLAGGVELGKVSGWLGHANEQITERHYKHWIRDARRDAIIGQLVDEAWSVGR